MFLFVSVLLLVKISAILDHIAGVISAILDHIGEVSAQKPPKKGYFVDAESVRRTLEIFNLTTTKAILMKLTTIMSLHESVNWKALRARYSFFWLNLIASLWSFFINWTTFGGVFHEKPPKVGSKWLVQLGPFWAHIGSFWIYLGSFEFVQAHLGSF